MPTFKEKRPCGNCQSTDYALAGIIDDGPGGAYCNLCMKSYEKCSTKPPKEGSCLNDKSTDNTKEPSLDARIMHLELRLENQSKRIDLFDRFIGENTIVSLKKEDSSPWKSAIKNPPPHGEMVLTRIKQENGVFGYAISANYCCDGKTKWYHDPLNMSNCFRGKKDFEEEWMEIPK